MSELPDGTFAQYLTVPTRNLVPKPEWLSFDGAACLPVAWTTAYRMLFTKAGIRAGPSTRSRCRWRSRLSGNQTRGGLGAVVYATSRSRDKRQEALSWGAHAALADGERLPEKVDVVIETVGAATWEHSLRSLRPGDAVVVAGATSGAQPPAELTRIFYLQQRILGSTGCKRSELVAMLRMTESTGARPAIDRTPPLMTAAAIGLSHSPLIGLNDPAPDVLIRVGEAFATAKEFVREFAPDLVVLYVSDHYNGFFYKEMPPCCMATAAAAVGDFGSLSGPLSVDGAVAQRLAEGVLARGIDLTISSRMVVDHGFAQPLEILFGGIDRVPVVPVFVNGGRYPAVPGQPDTGLGNRDR